MTAGRLVDCCTVCRKFPSQQKSNFSWFKRMENRMCVTSEDGSEFVQLPTSEGGGLAIWVSL